MIYLGSVFSCMIPTGALEMMGLALPEPVEPSPQLGPSTTPFAGTYNILLLHIICSFVLLRFGKCDARYEHEWCPSE